ncbi:MAG TPA: flavoprotein [Micromonosporaceae bacterium]
MRPERVLYVVVCGAGPASEVHRLVSAAQDQGWIVQVIATPAAVDFLDMPRLEKLSGHPVRTEYRISGASRSLPSAQAAIVAPATYNTVNKLAAGVSDNYALGVLTELIGLEVPVVVLPFVNSALASRRPFLRSVHALRDEGVRVLFGPGEFQPHPPGSGGGQLDSFPWHLALSEAEAMAQRTPPPT